MLEKHRDELETFAIEFANRLGNLESISSVDAVRVHRESDNVDVSAEFGTPTGAILGTTAQFTLADAQNATSQLKGIYRIYCEITTSESEKIIETPLLFVKDDASTT